MAEIHYKIRHKTTGLYSKGTCYNEWNTTGKTWNTLGKLRSFLTRTFNNDYLRQFVPDYEVIELEVRHTGTKQVHEMIDPKKLIGLLAKDY